MSKLFVLNINDLSGFIIFNVKKKKSKKIVDHDIWFVMCLFKVNRLQ